MYLLLIVYEHVKTWLFIDAHKGPSQVSLIQKFIVGSY
jgi:hypothetical protein